MQLGTGSAAASQSIDDCFNKLDRVDEVAYGETKANRHIEVLNMLR